MHRHALAALLAILMIAVAAPALAGGGNGNGNGNGKDNGNGPSSHDTSVTLAGGNGHGNGNGNGQPSPGTSSIAIATVNGAPMGPAAADGASVHYGDQLTFATTVEKLAGWEYPMVALSCYQDLNGDGTVDTNLLGPEIVFGLLDHPDSTFELAGSSRWAERGGEAVCRADLDAYGWKGGTESIRELASTGDWTAGW